MVAKLFNSTWLHLYSKSYHFGSAALPSVVDVYVNNQKTFSQKINPGPFDITHLPVPGNGAGQVNLVVKDILGNEQIITKNFYQSPILLAKG
jgi:outer membrane usher protein